MFESFVYNKIENENLILKKLLESVPAGEHLTRIQILNSSLSDFTKNYLLYEFNEKGESEEFIQKISKSNKLYFNYTIRPKWTLQTFLFNNFESRPPTEIVKKLNLFTFYSFYTDAVKDFITDNFQIFITKGEVTSIIDHTNEAIHKKLTVDINNAKIKNFLLQIFLLKYDSESNYNLESTIPFSFIGIFLEDKSFIDLEKKFRVIKGINSDTEISLKDIIKVLTDKYNVPEKQEVTPPLQPPENKVIEKPVIKEDHKKAATVKVPIKPVDKNDEIILSDKIKSEIKIPDAKKPVEINSGKELPGTAENIYSEQLIEADKKKASVPVTEETKIPPAVKGGFLNDLFEEKQLEKILNKVYKSDKSEKEKSFFKLSNFKTWTEASKHLKEVFKANNVNLYNKDIISFVNILNEYYKNRE